jgi:hypothetical protein
MLSLFAIYSCEKVIDIDLKNSEPQIVIDGTVTGQPGPYMVKISKTDDYYKPGTFPAVSGAEITISDDAGNSEILSEVTEGIYQTSTIQGVPGRTYSLKVIAEGKEYTAVSTMREAVEIDSLNYEYQPGGSFGPDETEGYKLHIHFTDPAGIENYCRFKVYKNGQLAKGYYLYDDKYTNGNSYDYNDFEDETILQLNDTAIVELLTLDKSTYDYYSTLSNVLTEGDTGPPMMMTTPANPNSNLSNGALGYFGAFAVRSDSIVIQ